MGSFAKVCVRCNSEEELILGFKRYLAHETSSSDDNGFAIFLIALIIFSSIHCYDRV